MLITVIALVGGAGVASGAVVLWRALRGTTEIGTLASVVLGVSLVVAGAAVCYVALVLGGHLAPWQPGSRRG